MKQAIYEISTAVTDFFWDDAPLKYGLEAREGQQEMAFDILDAIRRGQHITVEAGVGIGKSFAYLVPLLLYNQQTRAPCRHCYLYHCTAGTALGRCQTP